MSIEITIPPSTSPISIAEVKSNSNIFHNDDDVLIQGYIDAAVEYVEKYCGIALIERAGNIYIDCFTDVIYSPIHPLKDVSAINYIDQNGVTQTVNSSIYKVDYKSNPSKISLKANQSWPDTANELNAVIIESEIGYGNASEVPNAIKQALLLIVDHWYEHRSIISELSLNLIPELNLEGLLVRYRTHIL